MNNDATEAALGLLGLSPLNAPQSQPEPQPESYAHPQVAHVHRPSLTSSAIGIAIDRKSASNHVQFASSLVPLKRKQSSPASPTTTAGISPTPTTPVPPSTSRENPPIRAAQRQSPHPLATSSTPPIKSTCPLPNVLTKSSTGTFQPCPQQLPFSPTPTTSLPSQTPPTAQHRLPSPSTSQHPLSLAYPPPPPPPPDSDAISCICGFTYDDGFSIACDDCSRWCHAACFGIIQGGEVPEFWKCWVCNPAVEVDKERAVKIQKGRLKAMRMKASHVANGGVTASGGLNGLGGNTGVDDGSGGVGKPVSRRKTSPGVERKPRRGSAVAAAIDGSGTSKKRRRASMLAPPDPLPSSLLGPPTSNHTGSSTHSHSFHASSSRISHSNASIVSGSFNNAHPTPITFPPDIYPHPSTHAQLLRVARAWRGVTALSPPSPLINPPPRTYNDGGYTRVDSQGYSDRYGYSMSPLDTTTPVILDENAGDIIVPRTVLRTDSPSSCSHSRPHSSSRSHSYSNSYLLSNASSASPSLSTHTPPHLLRPPSPRLHVASEPSPFVQAAPYATPPVSNGAYTSPSVPYSVPSTSSHPHPRSYAKSPFTLSTNTTPSLNTHSTTSSNTAHIIPASTLLAPYTATIVPSSAYLADPLSGYAHLGMGKPQVRLVGGGWEVGVDARGIGAVGDALELGDQGGKGAGKEEDVGGGKTRWARCGCWPNAVVRPVICGGTREAENKRGKRRRHRAGCGKAGLKKKEEAESPTGNFKDNGPPRTPDDELPKTRARAQSHQTDDSPDQEDSASASDSDTDPTTLSFALFALRDLKADEEIVLGWEWDDGHAVHMLPALMESPGIFGPAHLHHLRAQFTSILHALSGTFTTCACGSSTRDCAVRVMERVVEGRWPWPKREMTPEGSGESSEGESGEGWDAEGEVDVEGDADWDRGVGMDVDLGTELDINKKNRPPKKRKVRKRSKDKDNRQSQPKPKKVVDLGPLVGVKRGFRTREREPMSGGWCGVEIVPSSLAVSPELGMEGEFSGEGKVVDAVPKSRVPDEDDMDVDDSSTTLPPRMRKPWAQPPATQSELSEAPPPRDHRQCSDKGKIWGWRSSPDTNAESPISISGAAVEGSGARRGGQKEPWTAGGDDGADGQDTDFDTETEADAVDDTRQMPPPPMPASLDPTTVSSLAHAYGGRSASPRVPVQWENNGLPRVSTTWIPPRTPTPTSATARTSQLPNQGYPLATPAPSYSLAPPPSAPSQVPQHDAPSSASLPPTHTQAPLHPPALTQTQPQPQAQLLPPTVSPSAPFSKLSLHSPDVTPSSPLMSFLLGSGESASLSPASASASTCHNPRWRVSSPPQHKPSKPLHVHPQNEPPSVSALVSIPAVRIDSPVVDIIRDTPAEAQHQHCHMSSPESRHDALTPPDTEKTRTASAEAHRVRFVSPEVLSGLPGLMGKGNAGDIEDADVDVEDDVDRADSDVMDVDVDVGNGSSGDVSGPGHALSTEDRRLDHLTKTQLVPAPIDGPSPENHSSPLLSQPQDPPSEHESTPPSLPEPSQSAHEPSPPPPPKVKMSLKDFALRKKKQREEEMAAKARMSPSSPDGPGLPPSPSMDGKRDLAGENTDGTEEKGEKMDVREVVNGQDVEMKHATVAHAKDAPFPSVNGKGVNGSHNDNASVPQEPRKPVLDQPTSLVEKKTSGVTVVALVATQPPPQLARPLTPPPRALDRTAQTQINGRTEAAPVTLKAKVEMMDGVIPSGLVGADEHTLNAVSFAPEPPPPPLTIRQTNDATIIEGSRMTTPASTASSTSTSAMNSRSTSIGISVSAPLHPSPAPYAHVPPLSSSIPLSRRPSHEDGEIPSSTPPKTYQPRSHTPPTQPRSFHAAHPPSPSFGPTSSSSSSSSSVPRRPAPPPLSRSPLSNAASPGPVPISSRPLPSGPRALRGSMNQPTHPPYASTRPPYVGSQYIPRGPSADRDRMDWDRDRQWTASSRSRGSNGWGR